MKKYIGFSIVFLLLPFLEGCQKLPEGMPKLYPAKITITQENIPLEGAIIQMIPEDPVFANWGPAGLTDSSGTAKLRTNGRYAGAPAGKFKVLVTKREIEPHPHPEWSGLPDGDPKFAQYRNESMKLKAFDYVELKFGLINETPLSVEVTSSNANNFQLDVGKKVANEAKRTM